MPETLTFRFEGALADSHRMNFYESARFQYAAARLIVKLAQFRSQGKFVKKITDKSNSDVQLVSQSDGSFNINIESSDQEKTDNTFVQVSLTDLIAYITERLVEKIDEATITETATHNRGVLPAGAADGTTAVQTLDRIVEAALADKALTAKLPVQVQDLVRRRAAETYRERRLIESRGAIARIDAARSQRLIAMSAPLVREMATALRKSADTLEIKSSTDGHSQSVFFLDRQLAREIETAVVDEDITPILGDIKQFNKDNGWGKLKIEIGTLSFSIPSDILPTIKQRLIDSMKRDLVYLQTYFVRDRGGEPIRLVVVGILPTPPV